MTFRTFVLSLNHLKYIYFIQFFKSIHLIDFFFFLLSFILSFY